MDKLVITDEMLPCTTGRPNGYTHTYSKTRKGTYLVERINKKEGKCEDDEYATISEINYNIFPDEALLSWSSKVTDDEDKDNIPDNTDESNDVIKRSITSEFEKNGIIIKRNYEKDEIKFITGTIYKSDIDTVIEILGKIKEEEE